MGGDTLIGCFVITQAIAEDGDPSIAGKPIGHAVDRREDIVGLGRNKKMRDRSVRVCGLGSESVGHSIIAVLDCDYALLFRFTSSVSVARHLRHASHEHRLVADGDGTVGE
jgi:hypothetical protein